MRLTMLLDSYNRDALAPEVRSLTSSRTTAPTVHGPQPGADSAPVATATPSSSGGSNAEFDRLLDGLLPCRVEDPELWFAERTADVDRAKALCQQCPLLAGCLQGALDRSEPWGVWGGEVFVDGQIVAVKRGRGRPRKVQL